MIENHMLTGDPERGTYDPEPYRQRALDDVIETIMLFGQWPQPNTGIGWIRSARRVEFDLAEWCAENINADVLAAFLVSHIALDDDRDIRQDKIEKEITAKLRAHLAESDMVDDKIDDLHADEMEEANGR